MAGGNWTTQNKVRAGVYIRFRSNADPNIAIGDRGTVAICEPMSWGPVSQVMKVSAGEDTTPYCGYDATNPKSLFLQQIFLGTNRTPSPNAVLLYRPAATGAEQAKATSGALTATALYPGVRGNDISVVITEIVDQANTFTVSTVVSGDIVDVQTAKTVEDLKANKWVSFSGSGALTATAGVQLAGGADGTVENSEYSNFLAAIEPFNFDILIYDGTESTIQAALIAFVKRLCEENGQYCQLVASGLNNPDSRYVINVASGVVLNDGTTLTPAQVCWWAGGAQAGAQYNQSLTYASYPNAVDVSPKMTNAEIIAGIQQGDFLLFEDDGTVKVETDINSLVTYTPDISASYAKNRVMRLLNSIANDIYREFSQSYIGVVNNNDTGRALFKSAIIGYMLRLQGDQAIQNFTADDVQVSAGEAIDSIVINLAVQPVDSVEKIYMTVLVS